METHNVREIRLNPVIPMESVLIASASGNKPKKRHDEFQLDVREHVAECQFCRGNEHLTPEEIVQSPKDGDWQIRVVRNLFPILDDDYSLPDYELGLHRVIDGYGRHEVIIDHANHGIQLCEMEPAHLQALFIVYRERMKRLYDTSDSHKFVLVFKNFGPASGGSIAHTHSQVIAMPIIPANVEMEIESSRNLYKSFGRCIFCVLIDENLSHETTVFDTARREQKRKIEVGNYFVDQNDSFVAIKPFASRYPWEMHILPRSHSHDYRTISDQECLDLGNLLRRIMARLRSLLGVVQYNYFLHSAPAGMSEPTEWQCFHWHLEICPRTTIPNGFELGSGLAINTLPPEEAVAQLRAVELAEYIR